MNTIRAKLAFGLTLCFAALFSIGGYAVFYTAKKDLYTRIDEKVKIDTYSIMSATYLKGDDSVELHFTVSLLREYSAEVQTSFYQIWDLDGTTLKKSESLLRKDLPQPARSSNDPYYWDFKLPDGRHCRAMGIRYGPKERGHETEKESLSNSLVLVVAEDIDEEMAALTNLRFSLFVVAGLVLALTPTLVSLVLRKGLYPLENLASKTGNIDSNSLTQRFPVDSLPGELKPIANQLNQLLDRLSKSFERERTFSADVAHELRTPIAELRTMAEVGLKWKDPSSAEDYQASLEIATQMERIVNQLFELMRCESDQFKVTISSIHLNEFVEKLSSHFASLANDRKVEITLSIPSETMVKSDPEMLERIVGNLLENAINYSPRNAVVKLSYHPRTATLQVENQTSDLTPADVSQFFDRFWRKDQARADGSHSGIGLSISRAFAERLQLSLKAELIEQNQVALKLVGLN